MTITETLPASPADEAAPTPPTKRRLLPRLAVAALVVLLAASVAGGVMQYRKTQDVAGERDTAQRALKVSDKSLKATEDKLGTTQTDLSNTESDLSSAETTVSACADVATAAQEMFDSTGSLLEDLQAVLVEDYTNPGTRNAGENLDNVKALMDKNGFEDFESFVASCSGDDSSI